MNLRRATPDDLDAMLALERATPTAAHWSRAEYERLFAPAAARLALVVPQDADAEAGGVLAGFLVGRDLGSEWELENVVVAPSSRRRGLGARLVNALLEQACARGARAVFLEVRGSNAAARALYEKQGFRPAGCRPGYYSDPAEDAIVYRFLCVFASPKNG